MEVDYNSGVNAFNDGLLPKSKRMGEAIRVRQ